MEESNHNHGSGKGNTCTCPACTNCGCGWHHGHVLFRIVLVCVLLLVAFWVGVMFGELREYAGFNGSRTMMYRSYGYGYPAMQNQGGSPMMPATTSGSTTTTP